MKNTDARAAGWIVWCNALGADTRVKSRDRAALLAYATKLGTTVTPSRMDIDTMRIVNDFVVLTTRRAGP